MPVIPISELEDPRIAMYRSLPKSTFAQESGLFVTEGDKVTERMFGSLYQAESVLVEDAYVAKYRQLGGEGLTILVVSRQLMSETVGFKFHRGVMGCGRRRAFPALRDVVNENSHSCLFAVCPDLQDPTNLGTLIRTSLALGVDALLLGPHAADPLSRRVIRVSMGAALKLKITVLPNLLEDLRWLRDDRHFELCATVLDEDAELLSAYLPSSRTAMLFGSEGHGLSAEAIELCQRRLTIPMPPSTDSLNAAVAAGIFLYHCATKR